MLGVACRAPALGVDAVSLPDRFGVPRSRVRHTVTRREKIDMFISILLDLIINTLLNGIVNWILGAIFGTLTGAV